jgi:stage II sporulation protein P
MINREKMLLSLVIVMIFLLGNTLGASAEDYFELNELDERVDGFYIMKDIKSGETIMRTARIIHPGDEYINSANKLYRVERLEGDIAWAHFIEDIKLLEISVEEVLKSISSKRRSETFFAGQPQQQRKPFLVGVYHSHGAESYVPSDGAESIPQGGGILEVGKAFTEALREKGLHVKHSEDTHIPHDAGAYNRSRRTAEEFLNEGVSALFDIHRDAVPPEEYIATVEGRPTVQLQLVVGRQNQNLQANRDFAEGLKNITDERHPGLIKGIFMARGNYNQDMLPLAMLVEVGSHENTREGAERSIALFSDSVTAYFLGREGDQAREGVGAIALKSVLWLVLLAGVALGVYMLISTRNMEELRSKFRGFFKKEFAELGGRKKDGKDGEEEAGE